MYTRNLLSVKPHACLYFEGCNRKQCSEFLYSDVSVATTSKVELQHYWLIFRQRYHDYGEPCVKRGSVMSENREFWHQDCLYTILKNISVNLFRSDNELSSDWYIVTNFSIDVASFPVVNTASAS